MKTNRRKAYEKLKNVKNNNIPKRLRDNFRDKFLYNGNFERIWGFAKICHRGILTKCL